MKPSDFMPDSLDQLLYAVARSILVVLSVWIPIYFVLKFAL